MSDFDEELERLERMNEQREGAEIVGTVLLVAIFVVIFLVLAWMNADADREYVRWLLRSG